MEIKTKKRKSNKLSYIVFGLSFTIVGLHVISILFPSFYTSFFSNYSTEPFIVGKFYQPIIITYVVLFVFGILYYTKNLPILVRYLIHCLRDFETSKKVSYLVILVLIGIYVSLTIDDLGKDEISDWPDFKRIQPAVDGFPFYDEYAGTISKLYIKNFFLFSSQEIFNNIKIIPYLASIFLIIFTYLFTVKITQKRFAGLLAIAILIQSQTFMIFSSLATYSNFWTLFFLISLYLVYKNWYLSPILLIASIFSKFLSIAFVPLSIFFILRTRIQNKTKVKLIISYFIIVALVFVGLISTNVIQTSTLEWDSERFWSGFGAISYQLRFENFVLIFLLPLMVGLFMLSRKGNAIADAIAILIVGTLIAAPLLSGFTGYNIQPHRYIPFIVFFGVGVGVLFSKKLVNRT